VFVRFEQQLAVMSERLQACGIDATFFKEPSKRRTFLHD
jgi:hypothetical protein